LQNADTAFGSPDAVEAETRSDQILLYQFRRLARFPQAVTVI
jgi:hypothetical protein